MTEESDRLDRDVISVLDDRRAAAGEALPWNEVAGRVAMSPPAPNRTRWGLVAASLLLVVGAVAALSTIVNNDSPAVSELPPPSLDPLVLEGVGATRPLSSIVEGEVAVPTMLFSELMLEPVIEEGGFMGSTWFARDGDPWESGAEIRVNTSRLGERTPGTRESPDRVLTTGGVEWAVQSFGSTDHGAFAEIDQVGISIFGRGIALSDLELVLDGLRAGEPQAHASSVYDPESDGVMVTRSSDGQHSLEATFVGEWLCSTTRSLPDVLSHSACVIPAPQDDGSMLIQSMARARPVNGDSSDLDDPLIVTVSSAGFVPADAIGANVSQADGTTEFAPAEDRSDSFDVHFFLDVRVLDDQVGSDPAELLFLDQVDVTAVFGE